MSTLRFTEDHEWLRQAQGGTVTDDDAPALAALMSRSCPTGSSRASAETARRQIAK